MHHLAVDGVSWRILLEDINVGWAQCRAGQQVELTPTGTSFQRWAALLTEFARRPDVTARAADWAAIDAAPATLPPPGDADTYATAGRLSLSLDAEHTRLLLGEVPAAFHAGVQDVLLIGFALRWPSSAAPAPRSSWTSRATAGTRSSLADVDLSRTVGWFTTKYPVALVDFLGGRSPAAAGGRRQGRQGTAARPAAPPDLRSAEVPAAPSDLVAADPTVGFNYLGRLGFPAESHLDELWRLGEEGLSLAGNEAPLPLFHTLELNAGTVDTDAGPQLRADWTWATSVLDHADVEPAEPAVVRRADRHLRARPRRRGWADALRHRARPADPAADRRPAAANTGSPTSCR